MISRFNLDQKRINFYENPEIFQEKVDREDCLERLRLNKIIIDFDEIPHELQSKIKMKITIF